MTFRAPYTNANAAARAAFRAITGRLGRGYDPMAYAQDAGTGINAGFPVLHVEVNASPGMKKRPSDQDHYTFEIRCDNFATAADAAQILNRDFYGIKKGKGKK